MRVHAGGPNGRAEDGGICPDYGSNMGALVGIRKLRENRRKRNVNGDIANKKSGGFALKRQYSIVKSRGF